ncbi:IclR family transcriptional regulator domain-containing protein [Sphingomonas crusticola]|uniref:IclR family transcriptional regulator domain-containing protein n=1 Tax=Sphingomonas crusticola TaxID=1697973 RepID=UPI000E2445AF|nr:IclR family transcriptional regulator C-terminal domain-containing protein [Sphingomonas crusticola]
MAVTEKPPKDSEYLSTLERGLRVLRSFDAQHPEMQLSEVAQLTKLSPAVARRCLNTLVQLGYVAQYGRKFLLRAEVLSFGTSYLSSMNVEQIVLPPLQGLRDETGDSSSMAVLSGDDILYVAHVSTNRRIRLSATVGTRFPLHATSLGKVLLAFQDKPVIAAYLDRAVMARFTERTVTTRSALETRLRAVRETGYDSALDELDYGLVSVAVPVLDAQRRVVAAINCSTSTSRISQDELVRTRLPLLRDAAAEIGNALQRWPALIHSLHSVDASGSRDQIV